MNMQEKIAVYIRLRDHKRQADDEFKKSMEKVNAAMTKLEGEFMEELNRSGLESLSADAGTVYTRSVSSASVKDRDEFLKFVLKTKNLELLDVRANKTIVRELSQSGTVVPGVNFSQAKTVGIRRGKSNGK